MQKIGKVKLGELLMFPEGRFFYLYINNLV